MTDVVEEHNLSCLSNEELMMLEREVARKYLNRLSIPMVAWPFANLFCWLSLWPLVLTGNMQLWLAFPIAIVNMTLAYLPSHEAQHDIYARPGEKLRWLNLAIGHLSLIPLVFGYRILRLTHLEHHKHTNDPELDPDRIYNGGKTFWETIKISIEAYQPGSRANASYADCLERIGTVEAQRAFVEQIFIILTHMGILFVCAYNGKALEALLLWWLPLKIGIIYIRIYLSWLPHYPGDDLTRYGNTRRFTSWLGVWSSLGMTAHIVHHLHPRIPLDKTPVAMREMMPILQARNCRLD